MSKSKPVGAIRLREETYNAIRDFMYEHWKRTGENLTFGGLLQDAWEIYLNGAPVSPAVLTTTPNDDVLLILARNLQDAEIALGKAQAIIRAAQGDDARKEVGAGDASAAETATQQAAASLDKAVGELKGSFGSATLTRRKRIK